MTESLAVLKEEGIEYVQILSPGSAKVDKRKRGQQREVKQQDEVKGSINEDDIDNTHSEPVIADSAVRIFNRDPSVTVFLLHASTAAAGLTLTVASKVVLMEPFTKSGEELQAMNRYVFGCVRVIR